MQSSELKYLNNLDISQKVKIEKYFVSDNETPIIDKINNFGKYSSYQSIARFLTKYELFKKILNIHGSIVECGVYQGNSLLTWGKLSTILEPTNHTRSIYGFDTFEGFPELHQKDLKFSSSEQMHSGGFKGNSYENILNAIDVYDVNRPLNHINKITIIKGDITKTAEIFIKENPYIIVSLLYISLGTYEATKKSLELFLPRLPNGGIIVFDGLNLESQAGESIAVLEFLRDKKIKINRFNFYPICSYAIME